MLLSVLNKRFYIFILCDQSYSNESESRNEEVQDPRTEKKYPFRMGGHTPGPVDISTARAGRDGGRDGGGGAVNPMHVRGVDGETRPLVTVCIVMVIFYYYLPWLVLLS